MGLSRTVYVGPYVLYSVAVGECTIPGCMTIDCPKPSEGFCQKCGKSAPVQDMKALAEIPDVDVFELLDEALVPAHESPPVEEGRRVYILTPNNHGCVPHPSGRKSYFRSHESDLHQPVLASAMGEEKSWLARSFAPELQKLRDVFGTEHVKIEWGVVTWYS